MHHLLRSSSPDSSSWLLGPPPSSGCLWSGLAIDAFMAPAAAWRSVSSSVSAESDDEFVVPNIVHGYSIILLYTSKKDIHH